MISQSNFKKSTTCTRIRLWNQRWQTVSRGKLRESSRFYARTIRDTSAQFHDFPEDPVRPSRRI